MDRTTSSVDSTGSTGSTGSGSSSGSGSSVESTDISSCAEWQALQQHAAELETLRLRELFASDADRARRFTATVGDLVIDWSKNRLTDRTIELLAALAGRAGVSRQISAMLAGEPVNVSEGRPALHTALRARAGSELRVAGSDVVGAVRAELERMAGFARRIRGAERLGATGRPIRTLVNLGVGGSNLGPLMACEALAAYRHERVECRFVSSVDPAALATATVDLDPAETLFVVVSKSFETTETMANAHSARAWLAAALGDRAVAGHFAAVSCDVAAMAAFGIAPDDCFKIWDWVGGRYSLDSAAGLVLMVAIGPERFEEMLDGMRTIDEYLQQRLSPDEDTPGEDTPDKNLPGEDKLNVVVLLGLIAIWNRNFCGFATRAVVPYSYRLRHLPAWLRQLDMESNGKRVRLDGTPLAYDTGPIVWGEAGTDAQHSFHQYLHQGSSIVPCDFIAFAQPDPDSTDHTTADLDSADPTAADPGPAGQDLAGRLVADRHDLLLANCLAQSEALAFGRNAAELEAGGSSPELIAHRVLPGDRPSTTILAARLTPAVLGQLLALYEHQVVVQGAVWGINSFDQWGVELGKVLAGGIFAELTGGTSDAAARDSSTNSLVARCRELRE